MHVYIYIHKYMCIYIFHHVYMCIYTYIFMMGALFLFCTHERLLPGPITLNSRYKNVFHSPWNLRTHPSSTVHTPTLTLTLHTPTRIPLTIRIRKRRSTIARRNRPNSNSRINGFRWFENCVFDQSRCFGIER